MGELFPHNQKVYNKVIEAYQIVNKVAVVQATGTGKGYLAAEFINTAFKNSRTLILAPNTDILVNYKENFKISNNNRVLMMTYPKLLSLYKNGSNEVINYEYLKDTIDFLIVDEFHRTGAEQWGKVVCDLISYLDKKGKKVLGLSATPIRYNDSTVLRNDSLTEEEKQELSKIRNMADEIFEGNVIYGLSLEDAVYCNVLPEFTYVLMNYGYDEDVEQYIENYKEIEMSYGVDSNAAKKYKKCIENLMNLDSSDRNVRKQIETYTANIGENQKWIVFCNSTMQLDEIDDSISVWFNKGINRFDSDFEIDVSKVNLYSVSSKQSDQDNVSNLTAFYKNSGGIHIIKCINKLNEGAHLDDITGIFMMRKTLSPIVYLQQLGRALSSGKKSNPFIFDLMNNIENVRRVLNGEDEIINGILKSNERLKKYNAGILSSDIMTPAEMRYYRGSYKKDKKIKIVNTTGKLVNLFNEMNGLLGSRKPNNMWSELELGILHKFYPLGGSERVHFELQNRGISIRSIDAITQQARKYNLKNDSVNQTNELKWMPSEDEQLEKFFRNAISSGETNLNRIASDFHKYYMPQRNPKQIYNRFERIRVNGSRKTVNFENNGKRWTKNDIYALKMSIEKKIPIYIISMELGRSIPSIESKSQELGCVRQERKMGTVKQWTDEDKEFLIDNFFELSRAELAEHLGCSRDALNKAFKRYSLEIQEKRKKLGVYETKKDNWSGTEDAILIRLMYDVDWDYLCHMLENKTPKDIKRRVEKKCKELGCVSPFRGNPEYKKL